MRLRFYVTSSSDKDMSVSSWTRVVFESQTILLVLTFAWKTYSKRRLVDCFFNEAQCVAILKYEVNKMDVGRRQPSATFVISRASLGMQSRFQIPVASCRGKGLLRASHAHTDVHRGSSSVPAPRWGGLSRDEPKGPSAHGLLNLKVLQFTAKIEISITLPSTNFCISHLRGKNIQYLTFPYTKYKNLRYFHTNYFSIVNFKDAWFDEELYFSPWRGKRKVR